MRIKLNIPLQGFPAGREITIEDDSGVPVDKFWRRRLRDALSDNCVEVVAQDKPVKSKKSSPKKVED